MEMTKTSKEVIALFLISYFIAGYCKDVLEQRVEVLERDDIKFFQPDAEEREDTKAKREADYQCYADACNNLDGDLNAVNVNTPNLQHLIGNKYKRQVHDSNNEYTTENHEYGRANGKINPLANEETVGDVTKSNSKKHETHKTESSKPLYAQYDEINNFEQKYMKTHAKKRNSKRSKHISEDYFQGIDWSQYNVSPEEVEERAIRTEHMIEDHNKRDKKK